jgi:hypothetical protein
MRRQPIDHAIALVAHFWIGYCLLYPRALQPKTPEGWRCVCYIATLADEFDKAGRLVMHFREIRPNTDVQTVPQSDAMGG